jgi:TonB family protein
MDLEAAPTPETGLGFLKGCFVEGDPAQQHRARKLKRRALALSILLQIAFVVALVLFPVLSKGERISLQDMTPLPPYARFGGRDRPHEVEHHRLTAKPACRFCVPREYRRAIVGYHPTPATNPANEPVDDSEISRYGDPSGKPGGLLGANSDRGPVAPKADEVKKPLNRRSNSEPVQAALLIRRVEPTYPTLARQLRLEGRVELHAVIAKDGTIQALEAISGHPLLIQSAMEAVREWRYRPTIFNGQPVEVDTRITVIYSLNRD